MLLDTTLVHKDFVRTNKMVSRSISNPLLELRQELLACVLSAKESLSNSGTEGFSKATPE